ncbi:hypothetical protein CURTO8I2_100068 [Curtobacterium sp. 8I-2]|nr:hypothetical protein CURTO8I2_100068 [Curtobacterium sp. 8I-2]
MLLAFTGAPFSFPSIRPAGRRRGGDGGAHRLQQRRSGHRCVRGPDELGHRTGFRRVTGRLRVRLRRGRR